jgi:hypothetical protein
MNELSGTRLLTWLAKWRNVVLLEAMMASGSASAAISARARHLAAVKIDGVRAPANLHDGVPIPLALGLTWVLGLQAVEPAALMFGVEHAAGNQGLDPGGKIAGGGNDSPGPLSKRVVQVRVVSGQQGTGPRFTRAMMDLLSRERDLRYRSHHRRRVLGASPRSRKSLRTSRARKPGSPE